MRKHSLQSLWSKTLRSHDAEIEVGPEPPPRGGSVQ